MVKRMMMVLVFSATAFGADDYFTRWLKGPVKLVMTEDESETFKKLKTPEAKLTFMRIFWSRRDPNQETAINEFRSEFEARVAYANENHGVGTIPGWQTPMGQVYVVFGPPLRNEKRILRGRRAELWWYGKLRLPDLEPNEAFLFVDLHGDGRMYLVPPEPDHDSSVDRAQYQAEMRTASMFTIPYKYSRATDVMNTRAIERFDLNYEELLLTGTVTTEYAVKMLAFSWEPAFGSITGGKVGAEIRIRVPVKEMSFVEAGGGTLKASLHVSATILAKDDSLVLEKADKLELQRTQAELAGAPDAVESQVLRIELPAGEYRLLLTVEEPTTGRIGILEQALSVPAAPQQTAQ